MTKKRIVLVLEVSSYDPLNLTDDFIESDLRMELSCTTNTYDIVSLSQEVIE